MDKRSIKKIINFLKKSLIENGLHLESIALFGSAVNGNMNDNSDLDVVIISHDFKNTDLFMRAKMTMKSEIETIKKYKLPMDIINLSPEEFNESMIKEYNKYRIVA